MGQKVNPVGIRLGITRESNARWYPNGDSFANILKNDMNVREYIMQKMPRTAAIANILIERTGSNVVVILKSAKPGVAIGKKGEDIEKLRVELGNKFGGTFQIKIEEVRKPELEATLVADSVAQQLERRVMFRRAMKRAVTNAMRQGAKGIKISVAGRLGGAEIARTEWYREGRVPLHTFRADVDYGTAEAKTTYGIIGVKVWIFRGEILGNNKQQKEQVTAEAVA